MDALTLSPDDVEQLRRRVDGWRAAEDNAHVRGMEAAVLVGYVSAILARLEEPAAPDRVAV